MRESERENEWETAFDVFHFFIVFIVLKVLYMFGKLHHQISENIEKARKL